MVKIPPMNWELYRKQADAGESLEVRTGDVLDLLDKRDAALKALQDIVAECPRPGRPYGKRVVTIAKTGIKASS